MSFYNIQTMNRRADIMQSLKIISKDDLKREREIAQKKWFAYRFMSPLAATKHFADVYRKGVKAYVNEHEDRDLSERVQGLALNIFAKPSASLTELWRARQKADELGLPYELLVEFGFHFAGRRKWRFTPRPGQLFGSKNSNVAWPAELEKFLEERYSAALIGINGLPQFRAENYQRLVAQDSYREALTKYVEESAKPWSNFVGRLCVETRHLPMLPMMRRIPTHMRRGVISDIRYDLEIGILHREPDERLPAISYVPGCFGIPDNYDAAVPECLACPMAQQCQALAFDVSQKMMSAYGTISPVNDAQLERRRASGRKRKAAFDAREREKLRLRACRELLEPRK